MNLILEKMLEKFAKIARYSFYTVFVLAFAWVVSQLFFEVGTGRTLASVKEFFVSEEGSEGLDTLRVVYPDAPQSLEPTLLDPTTRQRLLNIYESLVKFDRDFKLRPALAVSWGRIDNLTWEFRLRPDVGFHDGTSFDADDVVASLERALNHERSELSGILSSIASIERVDDLTLKIQTHQSDPLLLQKLAQVLIIPAEQLVAEKIDQAVGTAAYRISSWEKGAKMVLEKFPDYWGEEAKFGRVELFTISDKSERVNMLLRGDAHLLAFVPFDAVTAVEERGFRVVGVPSLEVQFLLFNLNSRFMRDRKNRETISLAVDQQALVDEVGGYARPVNQFVSNGVFGFNPDIGFHRYDLEEAGRAALGGLKGKTLHFHLPKGLDVLGEHLRSQLGEIGVSLVVSYLEMDKLLESIGRGRADIYFFGFKADLGDSTDFLHGVVHSQGDFNVGNYSNSELDSMIDLSLISMDPEVRLKNLQEAMRIVVEDDIVGVPLFEYETLYSFSDEIALEPRIDGFIYFDEIIKK